MTVRILIHKKALLVVAAIIIILARTFIGSNYLLRHYSLTPIWESDIFSSSLGNAGNDKIAIFYNVYLPPDTPSTTHRDRREAVLRILEEQINQLGESLVQYLPHHSRELYFHTIGHPVNSSEFLQPFCNPYNITCTHVQHHSRADEVVTQQSMLEYCLGHPDERVVYLHPKGSFHPNEGQNSWRRNLTGVATSQGCLNPPNPTCNVCGLGFQATWGPLFLGNMYTAHCSYVRKLVPPLELEKRMQEILKTKPAWIKPSLYRWGRFSIPSERYVAEHWIGNHPDMMPCTTDSNGQWKMIPDEPFPKFIGPYFKGPRLKQVTTDSRDEYFMLIGLLWKWHALHNATPSNTSWVWSYFPQGPTFQEAVARDGMPYAIYSISGQQ